ncbi:hypothetical protein DSM106972_086460 [Dulcicalothrix desertica PCC 7102]|uniref:Uncharacterized protein n=1 Tax=Dulcicalothrix desertica PCC 7102 TaxID=232991 RepID=A0A433US00_9CYAN|nr:hypothetical protein DSM106972_086460 [Dulcicalothrix desertica PCC 7102]TWH43876.1 hypothetical protein CAL7102_07624 [Dulcicalothrix desertica PCC 7102]
MFSNDYKYYNIDALSPYKVVTYLEKHGWNKVREAEDISVWIYDKHDSKFGMFVPTSDDFVDYRQRTIEVLETIQQVEDRSTFEICKEIQDIHLPS